MPRLRLPGRSHHQDVQEEAMRDTIGYNQLTDKWKCPVCPKEHETTIAARQCCPGNEDKDEQL